MPHHAAVKNRHQGPCRVLLVGTSYPANLSDWRGLFIRHLAFALSDQDDLAVRIWAPPGEIPTGVENSATTKESAWLAKLMRQGGIAHLIRTSPVKGMFAALRLLHQLRRLYRREQRIDVYHINWLQNTLTLPDNQIPLLTTVLGSDMQLLKLPGMTTLLRRVFLNRQTMICPNAEWMVPALTDRFGDVATIRFIPFGIEPRWFAIKRRVDPQQIWLCVTRLTVGKLGALFITARPYFDSGERKLHLFGPMQEDIQIPHWVHYHGPTTPEKLCSEWFPRAHGLITLSQHAEGRPQVMLEAMAASLPIIASRISAHEDLLVNRKTGWLCGNENDLSQALIALGEPSCNIEIGASARQWAQLKIGTWNDCAERYVNAYRELTETHSC